MFKHQNLKTYKMSLLENLKWRYATKKMTGAPVEEEKVQQILEATRYSASSFGLQPYHIIVVKNKELKEKLSPASYNQPQIIGCSHLLVFCIWDGITQEKIDAFTNDIAKKRNQPAEAVSEFNKMISGAVLSRTKEDQNIWSAKQAYIALGTALAAAAELRIDSTPMEGFDSAQFDEILGLKEKGLKSVVILPLGHRDSESDYLVNLPKVRRDLTELVEEI